MVGLFDSGSGGLNTVRRIKQAEQEVDLVYLIDRENAPYGTKTEKEIIKISEDNIERLADMGAERVLIACCTASTVYGKLKDKYKKIAIPIIEAVANNAKNSTRSGRIGVIATERTVASRAFKDSLSDCSVFEHPTQELVGLIDGGICDGNATVAQIQNIESLLIPVLRENVDTLILGCTHFPSLKNTIKAISSRYGVRQIIDSADVGARLLGEVSRGLKLD